jgi:selenocysteine lyase/cysteine desulfurase
MSLPVRQPQFTPDTVYLDTPTYGLAAGSVIAVMTESLDRWRRGIATMAEYDEAVVASRRLFSEIVNADPERVAVANQVSVFVGVVASSLPDGSVVLAPEGDFASLMFPVLVQGRRGITLRNAPLSGLAAAVDADTDLVAFSLVQSADGVQADVDSVLDAAAKHGAATLVDATQAAGWLPIEASRFDYMVVSAYKWLLCPRGTAFMTLGAGHDPGMPPILAGWYSGEDPWESVYGTPLRLADSARRYDVSPAWLSWMGSVPALEIVVSHGVDAIHRHNTGLADSARERLGIEPTGSAIVTVPLSDTAALTERGISASLRSSNVRVGFHLYNDESDVDALVGAVIAGRAKSSS